MNADYYYLSSQKKTKKKNPDSSSFQKYIWPLFKYITSSFFRYVLTCESKSFQPSGFVSISEDEGWRISGLPKYKRKPVLLMSSM